MQNKYMMVYKDTSINNSLPKPRILRKKINSPNSISTFKLEGANRAQFPTSGEMKLVATGNVKSLEKQVCTHKIE